MVTPYIYFWLCWVFIAACITKHRLSCPACRILASHPGIQPESPVLEGEFLTTGSPGISSFVLFLNIGTKIVKLYKSLPVGLQITLKYIKSKISGL